LRRRLSEWSVGDGDDELLSRDSEGLHSVDGSLHDDKLRLFMMIDSREYQIQEDLKAVAKIPNIG
jgi:hypothetical protein